jgi:hypothetical protein
MDGLGGLPVNQACFALPERGRAGSVVYWPFPF